MTFASLAMGTTNKNGEINGTGDWAKKRLTNGIWSNFRLGYGI